MDNMTFYGTGAAEGIPNPFCTCPVCENARRAGGREVRRRSMFRLNQGVCIDMGADSFQQALEYGDFTQLQHVLVTHTHEDHLAYMMMNVRNMAIVRTDEPLHYYFTDKAYEIAEFYRSCGSMIKGKTMELEEQGIIAFHRLEFGECYTIGGVQVQPLKGNHFGNMDEHAANYLIGLADGRKLYYGLDTGWYLPETFDRLAGAKLDILISECTFGLTPGRGLNPDGHLDGYSCMELFKKLLAQGTITEHTEIYLTHINHYTSTHRELSAYFDRQEFPAKIMVTWDGYKIGE